MFSLFVFQYLFFHFSFFAIRFLLFIFRFFFIPNGPNVVFDIQNPILTLEIGLDIVL